MATFKAILAKRIQNTIGKYAKSPVACFVVVVSQAIYLPPAVVLKQIQNYSLYAVPINKCVSKLDM